MFVTDGIRFIHSMHTFLQLYKYFNLVEMRYFNIVDFCIAFLIIYFIHSLHGAGGSVVRA